MENPKTDDNTMIFQSDNPFYWVVSYWFPKMIVSFMENPTIIVYNMVPLF